MSWMWKSSTPSPVPAEEAVRGEDVAEEEKEEGVGVVGKAEENSEVEVADVGMGSVEGVKVGDIVEGGVVAEAVAAAAGKSTPMTKTPFHLSVVVVEAANKHLLLLLPLEATTITRPPPPPQHRTMNGDGVLPSPKKTRMRTAWKKKTASLLTYLLTSFLSYCHMENPNPDSKSGGLFYIPRL